MELFTPSALFAYLDRGCEIEMGAWIPGESLPLFCYLSRDTDNTLSASILKTGIVSTSLTAEIGPRALTNNESNMVQIVRSRFNDYAQTNRLGNTEYISDTAILKAIQVTLYRMSAVIPAFIQFATLEDAIRNKAAGLLIEGTVLSLVETLILDSIHNSVQYNAGGMSSQEYGRANMYESFYQSRLQAWESKVNVQKRQINISRGFAGGGVPGYGLSRLEPEIYGYRWEY
jgi:hypothetical protein